MDNKNAEEVNLGSLVTFDASLMAKSKIKYDTNAVKW